MAKKGNLRHRKQTGSSLGRGAGAGEKWRVTAGEYEVFSQANENVLKVNFVDACTMLCLYSKPQNGTLWGGGGTLYVM